MKIFGREPTAIVGAIEAALVLLISFGFGLTSEQIALLMAVVTAGMGLYVAWVTKDTMLGAVIGLIKAILALAVGFGFNITPEVTAALISFVTVGLSLFNRNQTYPLAAPPEPIPGTIPVTDMGTR